MKLYQLLLIILVLIVIVVLIFVLPQFGLGFGKGNGDGDGDGNLSKSPPSFSDDVSSVPESSVTEITEETVTESPSGNEVFAEVKVNESKYLFNNELYEMSETDRLISDIKADENISAVRIIDENASLAAYEALTDALKESNMRFIEFDSENN